MKDFLLKSAWVVFKKHTFVAQNIGVQQLIVLYNLTHNMFLHLSNMRPCSNKMFVCAVHLFLHILQLPETDRFISTAFTIPFSFETTCAARQEINTQQSTASLHPSVEMPIQ